MELIDIGIRFAEERERLSYSQAAFARLLGISRPGLMNIENGKSDFKVSQLIAAASAGIDVQYVVTGVRSKNTEKVTDEIGFERNVIKGNVTGVGIVGNGGTVHINHNPRTVVKAEPKPGIDNIEESECAILKDLVDRVVEKEVLMKKTPKSHKAVWSALNQHCKVASYRMIAKGDFEKARSYLTQWIGSLQGMKSAPAKDSDNWRKDQYKYIKTNAKDPADAEALKTYIKRNFGAGSLTELADDELRQTYRYISGRRTRRK